MPAIEFETAAASTFQSSSAVPVVINEVDADTSGLSADTDQFIGAACQLDICRGDHIRTVYGIISGSSG